MIAAIQTSAQPAGLAAPQRGGARRDVTAAVLGALLVAVSLAWVLDLPGYFGLALFDEQPLAMAAGLSLAIVAMGLGAGKGLPVRLLALLAAAVFLIMLAVVAARYPELSVVAMMRPTWLVGLAAVALGGLLVMVWRVIGATIVLLVAAFALVALYGGGLGVPTTAPDRMLLYMLLDPNGILGLPLKVAVQIVIPFVLFGELLRHSGGSEYLTRLSLAAFGGLRGGSAKAAIGASAVFGTISGNAVSNVVGTGIVTIPLIRRAGMKPETAGAIEAAASTGGQLLPPVMGAAAFVMADFLQVPYTHVLAAAILPALLYFAAIFIQVDRIAAREGVGGLAASRRESIGSIAREGAHFALPFAALFVVLFSYQTHPEIAALAAVASLVAVAVLRSYEGCRLGVREILAGIVDAGISAAPLILLTAVAGLIIGFVSLTGLGFSVAADAVAVSGGNILVLLLLVALIAIVFGMGMPTVAVYVVLATVLAPALVQAGLGEMQAHLFILYFGMMSMLTPPVALASITAAKIADADPWRTSFAAVRLAWVAYVIPFMFAFSPELLLGGSALGAILAAATAFIGIAAISVAAAGYARGPINAAQRLFALACGGALIVPPVWGLWAALANAAGAAGCLWLVVRPTGVRRAGVQAAPSSTLSNKEKSV